MGSGGLSFCLGSASLKPGEQGIHSLVPSSAGWLPIWPGAGVAGRGWCLLADLPHSMPGLLRNLLAPEAVFWVIFPLLNQHKMAALKLGGWSPGLSPQILQGGVLCSCSLGIHFAVREGLVRHSSRG